MVAAPAARQAEVTDFPLANQVPHGPGSLLDRRLGLGIVAQGHKQALLGNETIADVAVQPRVSMIGGMRVKTSVTIDERVLRAIDKTTTRTRSRSRVIEDAAREFLARRARAVRESRDLAILNESAEGLNREMEDVLAYQADV